MNPLVTYFESDEDPITPDRWYGLEEDTPYEAYDRARHLEERRHVHDFRSIRVTRFPELSAGAFALSSKEVPADVSREAA